MGITPEMVIEVFWQAADDLPENALSGPELLRLLAGLCERLDQSAPDDRFREEALQCRESAELQQRLTSGTNVRLAYAYSTAGDGQIELSTYNAEVCEPGESGTVVGTPGLSIVFDEAEARRAIAILGSAFPGALRK